MRTSTDTTPTNLVAYEYSPELLDAYMLRARRKRAEFIASSVKELSARLRVWLGGKPEPRVDDPRVVAQSETASQTTAHDFKPRKAA